MVQCTEEGRAVTWGAVWVGGDVRAGVAAGDVGTVGGVVVRDSGGKKVNEVFPRNGRRFFSIGPLKNT